MSRRQEALWISASPSLQGFDRPLLKCLAQALAVKGASIAHWQYSQSPDEPTCLQAALALLDDYVQQLDRPLNLLGHSTGGLLALLYARRHPERVRSLTLLSVGVHPAIDWQSHYYSQLRLLPCSRITVLKQMIYHMFGYQSQPVMQNLLKTLEADLYSSLSPQSLFGKVNVSVGKAWVPLLACSGQNDGIVDPVQLNGWEGWLEDGDLLWQCPGGRHFFHYFHPQLVIQQIVDFWASLADQCPPLVDQSTVQSCQPTHA